MNLDFLKTIITPQGGFELVDYASQVDFVGTSDESRTLPAVFFNLHKKKAQPNEYIGTVRQQVDVYISFKVVTKNKLLHTSLNNLKAILLGYAPPDALTSFEYVGGETVDVVKSVIWWQEIYKITILESQEPT